MKKYTLIFLIFVLLCFCMYGCRTNQDNQEQDYKTAISEHMNDMHGLSINNYESFCVNEDGSASATVEVTVATENGLGSMEMSTKLSLDKKCHIDSCSLCDLGIGYNGDTQKPEESSAIYQDFILRKTEQLTGFVISLEIGNYEEHEITENGHTYIDVFAFINIEEMAGTSIDSNSVFQLYAIINPDNEEDLFIAITGNSTGEIYRYDHTSIPHETADNDVNGNSTSTFSELEDERTRFDGRAAVSNGWIYYLGTGGLCRMKTDGSDKQLMSEDNVFNIEIKDDWVYYNNMDALYRIKTDGSNRQKLFDGDLSWFTIEQDWIYCSDTWNREMFRIKTDGSNKQRINDWTDDQITVADNWIYFGDLYRIKTDGTDLQELDYETASGITVIDGWVYYNSYNIYRIKTDGSQKQKLNDSRVGAFIIKDDWIYYSNVSDGEKFYRMKTDGTENQMFIDEEAHRFWEEGDWLFYSSWDSANWTFNGLFRIKTDGSQKQLICQS